MDRAATDSLAHGAVHSVDDPLGPFFYRVDSLMGVRAIKRSAALRARRWDTGDRFPHVALLHADTRRAANQAIFRLSFWRTFTDAHRDWRTRGSSSLLVMMRVPRGIVRRTLVGWNFAEDDHLDGRAELIWKLTTAHDEREHFHKAGIALEHLDVFNASQSAWEPWHESRTTALDRARLVASGWTPVAIHTRQGGFGMAYWRVVPVSGFSSHWESGQAWCLVTLDERMPGTLGGEREALTHILEQVLSDRLCGLAHRLSGVLTVTPTPERVWTEQFAVDWTAEKRRWLHFLRRPIQPEIKLERCVELSQDCVARLISDSGLPAAKPEFAPIVWSNPC